MHQWLEMDELELRDWADTALRVGEQRRHYIDEKLKRR